MPSSAEKPPLRTGEVANFAALGFKLEKIPDFNLPAEFKSPFGVDLTWLKEIADRRLIHLTELLPSQHQKWVDTRKIAQNPMQAYPLDYLASVIAKLRQNRQIPRTIQNGNTSVELPTGSRLGMTPAEINEGVIPEAAKLLGVSASAIRMPKISELLYINWINKIFEPSPNLAMEWTNTEYFDEAEKANLLGNLTLGKKGENTTVHFWPTAETARIPNIGFRLIVSA